MVTKEQFLAFNEVRDSGATNMFDIKTVSELSGLDKDTILEIMKDYNALSAKYESN